MWHTLEQLLSAGPSLSETEVALRWQQAIRMLSALGPEQQLQLRALALNHGLLQLPVVAGGGPGEGGEGTLVLSPTELASPGEAESTKQSSRRYESQKRRDWNTFGQYLKNHRPPIPMSRCTPQHVVDFLRYLDQFGKTKVHNRSCHFHGSNGSHPCGCPMRQAWGSLDSLVGRLRAAYEENGGTPENNPFGARLVRTYLRETRDHQAKARGIAYEKKKRKRPSAAAAAAARAVPGELPFLPGSSAVEPLQLRA